MGKSFGFFPKVFGIPAGIGPGLNIGGGSKGQGLPPLPTPTGPPQKSDKELQDEAAARRARYRKKRGRMSTILGQGTATQDLEAGGDAKKLLGG